MSKILLISDRSPHTGIGNYSYHLAKHLTEALHEDLNFINLSTVAEDSRGGLLNTSSLKIKRILDHFLYLSKIPSNYDLYHLLNPNLGILATKYRPIIVTIHDLYPFTEMATRDLVVSSLGLDLPTLVAMKLNMSFARKADRIITVSEHTKKEAVSLLGIEASRVRVVYLGVDRNLFHFRNKRRARQRLNLPLDRKIVLHVGVDEPRKNLVTLIKALYKVKKSVPDVILVRIGGMRSITQKLISSLGLGSSFIYYPSVSDIASFYNASDVLAFPSYYEGFGLPVLEAMSSGLPVVAGNCTSIPEIVGNAGLLFPPFDVTAFSDFICHTLLIEEARQKMAIDGIERSVRFGWKTCGVQTLEVYKNFRV